MADESGAGGVGIAGAVATSVQSISELAAVLRRLRRREARTRGESQLTYREIAVMTGWSHAAVGDYFSGKRIPPTDRFDVLVRLLGATGRELGLLATTRDRVEELRHPSMPDEAEASAVTRPEPEPVRTLDNLPHPLTRLIGRSAELSEVQAALLDADARLVTLVGAPGIGKSRLATAVAARMTQDFPDGVWYVSLEPVSDSSLVASTVINALGLKEVAGVESVELLIRYLRERRVLLVLDNFEHVLDAAPMVAQILGRCGGAKVLATSRAGLRIRGERLYSAPPLRTPAVRALLNATTAAEYPAIELFVERAQAVRPSFELTDANAPDVARICTDLDGLPLAIELVAARSGALSPADLVARLGDRLGLLTDGPRDLPARQRTLRDTIDWSYELLRPAEQRVFARLSVFVDGCSLDAAEDVAAGADSTTPVLAGLVTLTDMNLLRSEQRLDGRRYCVMLAMVREHGLERLAASGEEHAIRERYADFYLRLAEACNEHTAGEQQQLWLDRLEAEQHNLLAALSWYVQRAEVERALRMIAALWTFCHIRFRQTEGLAYAAQVLALKGDHDKRVRAQALFGSGWLAVDHGDQDRARRYFTESLGLYRALNDSAGVAQALNGVGTVVQAGGDSAEAAQLFAEGLRLHQLVGDEVGIAWSLDHLGNAALDLGEHARADELLVQSLEIFRRRRHSWGVALTQHHLGLTALALGRHDLARQRFTEARRLFTEVANSWGVAISGNHLGHVALAAGEADTARGHFIESFLGSRAEEDRHGMARALSGLSSIAVAEGDLACAARLFGAAEALAESAGIFMNPVTRGRYERDVAALRQHPDRELLAREWAEGSAMTMAEILVAADTTAHVKTQEPTSLR